MKTRTSRARVRAITLPANPDTRNRFHRSTVLLTAAAIAALIVLGTRTAGASEPMGLAGVSQQAPAAERDDSPTESLLPLNAVEAARTGEQTHTTSIGGLVLPQYIGPLEFIGERSTDEPTAALYSYRTPGLALDIRVTDRGAGGIPDGAASEEIARRFAEAKQDLVHLTGKRGLQTLESTVPLVRGDVRHAREGVFRLNRRHEGGTTYLWFTAAHGLLIEARYDVALGFEEDGEIGRGEILAAIHGAIPPSPQAVEQARARLAAPDSGVKVAILWDPETPEEESRIWLAYLFARAAYVANETAGGPAVGERESTFEEEVRGRSIALTTFRALKREQAQLASEYFSDIDRVEAAGFLREYVWSYLRRDSWRAPPAGLDLAGFDIWRAHHLPRHKPVTHGRIEFRVAAAQ